MDYHDAFSPVVKAVFVCLILTIVAMRGWKLSQVEISNAFLHGKLNGTYRDLKTGSGLRG